MDFEIVAAKWLYNTYEAHAFLTVFIWLLIGYVFGQLTCITQRLWDPSTYRPTLAFSDLYSARIYLSLLGPMCIYMFVFMNLLEIFPRSIRLFFRLIVKGIAYIPSMKNLLDKLPRGDKVLIK